MVVYLIQKWSNRRSDWYTYRSFDDVTLAKSVLARSRSEGSQARLVKLSGRSEVLING